MATKLQGPNLTFMPTVSQRRNNYDDAQSEQIFDLQKPFNQEVRQ